MINEQKIRAILFYLSTAIFFGGLPFILSFALGYKFDPHTLRFTKTGLIVLRTQPSGASIYLDGNLLNEHTPATINELLPGRYNLRIELEEYYPWSFEVNVEAGKVTRLEKIILFPFRPNIKPLNKDRLSSFWVDKEKGVVYYIDSTSNSIYKSDLEGEHSEKIGNFLGISARFINWKISPDREKILYFSPSQIGIAYLNHQGKPSSDGQPPIFNYPNGKIIDVFWHSNSYHLILVGNNNIEVLEVNLQIEPIVLVNLNQRNTRSYYDVHSDTLYFLDSQKAPDGNYYDNLYKLELNARAFPLEESVK